MEKTNSDGNGEEVAPQKEFKTLAEFVEGRMNFYLHFLNYAPDSLFGFYREYPHFERFQERNPELERAVTEATVQARERAKPKLPYPQDLPNELLWEAYKIMSKLVFVTDPDVMRHGEPDRYFLLH